MKCDREAVNCEWYIKECLNNTLLAGGAGVSPATKKRMVKEYQNNAESCWGRGRLARDKEGNGKLNPVIVQRFLKHNVVIKLT